MQIFWALLKNKQILQLLQKKILQFQFFYFQFR